MRAYIELIGGCKLDEKNEFRIHGFQVAGQKFNLYVLIQDHEGISRLCLSRSASIPTQYMDNSETIYEFIETLLLLRVDSLTVSSPPPNN
ncbi:2226_t:CDS:2 [Entrophospora sp. SA101]|nr:2226_t:CDS:2 [Entrophospora sp. SA101]